MAKLQPMRYKNYVWPHNPRSYSITYHRRLTAREVPYGYYVLQNLGQGMRVMKGSGEFVGEGAYEEFKRLATVYYDGGEGCWCIHVGSRPMCTLRHCLWRRHRGRIMWLTPLNSGRAVICMNRSCRKQQRAPRLHLGRPQEAEAGAPRDRCAITLYAKARRYGELRADTAYRWRCSWNGIPASKTPITLRWDRRCV